MSYTRRSFSWWNMIRIKFPLLRRGCRGSRAEGIRSIILLILQWPIRDGGRCRSRHNRFFSRDRFRSRALPLLQGDIGVVRNHEVGHVVCSRNLAHMTPQQSQSKAWRTIVVPTTAFFHLVLIVFVIRNNGSSFAPTRAVDARRGEHVFVIIAGRLSVTNSFLDLLKRVRARTWGEAAVPSLLTLRVGLLAVMALPAGL